MSRKPQPARPSHTPPPLGFIRMYDILFAIVLALSVASFAYGQDQSAPGEHSDAPLSGPDIGRAKLPSIVARTFEGTLERLDIWPEEAAIELLDLSAESRRQINDILAHRAAVIDKVISENLDDLLKLANDGEGGRWFGALTHLREFRQKIDARLDDTRPLIEQFSEALPAEQARELTRMVEEYWDAFAADEVGGELERLGGSVRATLAKKADGLRIMGEELGRSYQRIEKSAAVYAEHFVRELGFTGANAERVREEIRDFLAGIEDPENIADSDWIPVLRRLYPKLDEAGRERLFNAVLDQR